MHGGLVVCLPIAMDALGGLGLPYCSCCSGLAQWLRHSRAQCVLQQAEEQGVNDAQRPWCPSPSDTLGSQTVRGE